MKTLTFIDLGLDENAPADEPALAIHETTDFCSHMTLLYRHSRESGNPGTEV